MKLEKNKPPLLLRTDSLSNRTVFHPRTALKPELKIWRSIKVWSI